MEDTLEQRSITIRVSIRGEKFQKAVEVLVEDEDESIELWELENTSLSAQSLSYSPPTLSRSSRSCTTPPILQQKQSSHKVFCELSSGSDNVKPPILQRKLNVKRASTVLSTTENDDNNK